MQGGARRRRGSRRTGIMGMTKIIVYAASTLVALSASARAADMPEIIQQPASAIEQLGSTWYLRGDIAYRLNALSGADWNGLAVSDPGLANGFAAGVGIGAKMGWLRIDATADYAFPSQFQGGVPGVAAFSGNIASVVVLANAYADLGTWHSFTPYVGAGLGVAAVRAAGFTETFVQPPAGIAGADQWTFAWALMAGVGYSVTPNVLIDLGYRYLHLGDASTGIDQFGAVLTAHGMSASEVRLGVRYTVE
jgi:opacity protein-like surface antigen